MLFFIILGCIVIVAGIALVFSPGILKKASAGVTKVLIDVDNFIFTKNRFIGILFVLIGIYLLYFGIKYQ